MWQDGPIDRVCVLRNRRCWVPPYKLRRPILRMGMAQSSSSNPESKAMALAKAKDIVTSSPVVVFSKTYCPFCTRVKQLLAQLGASFKPVELDRESDGSELQSALAEWTGQRTVPNVFIKGNHIGGCDDTMAMNNKGKLMPLLTEAGAIASHAA